MTQSSKYSFPVSVRHTGKLNADGSVEIGDMISVDIIDTGDAEAYKALKGWLDLNNGENKWSYDDFISETKRLNREDKIDNLLDDDIQPEDESEE
jgi:hypothetical protein